MNNVILSKIPFFPLSLSNEKTVLAQFLSPLGPQVKSMYESK